MSADHGRPRRHGRCARPRGRPCGSRTTFPTSTSRCSDRSCGEASSRRPRSRAGRSSGRARAPAAHRVRRPEGRLDPRPARQPQSRLEDGDSLILFPEGTSSDGNRALPFKSALFAVGGVRVGDRPLTVQPVSLACTGLDGLPMGRSRGRSTPGTAADHISHRISGRWRARAA